MTVADPTDIWIGYEPRRWAQPMHASLTRWMCLVLHRRAGKTVATVNHLIRAATDDQWEAARLLHLEPSLTTPHLKDLLRDRFYGHVLPTYKQAEVTAWQMIRHYTAKIPGVTHNEQKLRTVFPNGARLQLFGADKPDSLRGIGFSGIAFDEYSQHPPTIFGEVISKALADHLGFAIFLGTIKGQNQLYKTYHAGTEDPAWFTVWQDIDQSLRTEEDATTLLLKQAVQDDYALIGKGLMSREEFEQEWYLSTDAAIRGAYYTKQISLARKDGRVTTVPYEPALPVDTNWDIGIGDATAIWFTQEVRRTGEIRVIDFYENSGEGLTHYLGVLKEKPYVYGEHWVPHDMQVREYTTGKSRLDTAAAHGVKMTIVRNVGLHEGIDAVRALLPRCWFDATRCEAGLEALTFYQKTYNDRLQEFGDTPLRNFATHAADAFRMLAVHTKPAGTARELPRRRSPFQGRSIPRGGPPSLDWMN